MSVQARPDPVTHQDRVRAAAALLALAEDEMVAAETRTLAAQTVLHAPAYAIDGDAQDMLADRVVDRIKREIIAD